MPVLRQVLPTCFFDGDCESAETATLLDVPVKEMKLNNGSPCSGHAEMFDAWPGEHKYVRQWFILENGKAVAIDEDPNSDWRFPVIDYEI